MSKITINWVAYEAQPATYKWECSTGYPPEAYPETEATSIDDTTTTEYLHEGEELECYWEASEDQPATYKWVCEDPSYTGDYPSRQPTEVGDFESLEVPGTLAWKTNETVGSEWHTDDTSLNNPPVYSEDLTIVTYTQTGSFSFFVMDSDADGSIMWEGDAPEDSDEYTCTGVYALSPYIDNEGESLFVELRQTYEFDNGETIITGFRELRFSCYKKGGGTFTINVDENTNLMTIYGGEEYVTVPFDASWDVDYYAEGEEETTVYFSAEVETPATYVWTSSDSEETQQKCGMPSYEPTSSSDTGHTEYSDAGYYEYFDWTSAENEPAVYEWQCQDEDDHGTWPEKQYPSYEGETAVTYFEFQEGTLYTLKSNVPEERWSDFQSAVNQRWPDAEVEVGKYQELDDNEYIAIKNTGETGPISDFEY